MNRSSNNQENRKKCIQKSIHYKRYRLLWQMCAVNCTDRCRPQQYFILEYKVRALTRISTVQKKHWFKMGGRWNWLKWSFFFYKYRYTIQYFVSIHSILFRKQRRHQCIFQSLSHYFAYDSPDPRRRCTSWDTAEGYRASGFVAWRTWPCSGKVVVASDPSCQNTGPLVIWRRLHNSWCTERRRGMIDIPTPWATTLWWVYRDWSDCVVFHGFHF